MPAEGDVANANAETRLLPDAAPTPDPQADATLRKLLLGILLFVTAITMTIPVRPLLILEAAGNDASLAATFYGIVESVQAVISIFASALFGAVSDVIGRKPVLLLSHVGELVGLLVVAQFPRSLVAQFPAYMLIALTNAYVTTTNTIVADISQASAVSSSTNYGYLGAVYGLCFLIGPALGGYIDDALYLAASFHAAAILTLVAMVYVYFVLPETKSSLAANADEQPPATNWRENASVATARITQAMRDTELSPMPRIQRIFARNEALSWIALSLACSSLASSGLISIFFLYANVRLGWEAKETGFFLSMLGLSVLIAQGVLGPLSVRVLGEVPTILLSYLVNVVHYAVYGLARSSSGMYMALFLGLFAFAGQPVMQGLLSRQVPQDSQGSLQGSVSALMNVVKPISPILSSTLFAIGNDIGRPGLPVFFVTGVSACSLLFVGIGLWKPGLK